MVRHGLLGLVAGATGTIALDFTTYGDMLVRGRAASGVPANLAGILAERIGLAALAPGKTDERAANRRSAAGALLGYSTGLGLGVVYALLRGRGGRVQPTVAGVAVGIAAMIASDVPIALTGVSDPRTWTPVDWASDLIPHLVYGLVTVDTYEAIATGKTTINRG
jgi:hypothetical protein